MSSAISSAIDNKSTPVTWKHFKLNNTWTVDEKGEKYICRCHKGQPKYIIDETTKNIYWNESQATIFWKHFGLMWANPAHIALSFINSIYRAGKLISFYHLWKKADGEEKYDIKQRLKNVGTDLLRIVLAPLAVLALLFATLYGMIISRRDGRKLYATIERGLYGGFTLAPCFQPNPTRHLFNGSQSKANAW